MLRWTHQRVCSTNQGKVPSEPRPGCFGAGWVLAPSLPWPSVHASTRGRTGTLCTEQPAAIPPPADSTEDFSGVTRGPRPAKWCRMISVDDWAWRGLCRQRLRCHRRKTSRQAVGAVRRHLRQPSRWPEAQSGQHLHRCHRLRRRRRQGSLLSLPQRRQEMRLSPSGRRRLHHRLR